MNKVCKICGMALPEKEFYYSHRTEDGLMDFCKLCTKEHFDIHEVCYLADVPFIYDEYERLVKYYGEQNNCIGRYLAKMKLASFKRFRYEDTGRLVKFHSEKILDCILRARGEFLNG